ncbi:MAG: RNA ligase (ATP) [Clostridia bacterium]|nr:RNA ligase (ATP) [Clostridia bacterium]
MNLASIQIIDKIIPIPGADKIELAQVLGWQAVVEKNKYKEGEKIIYIQLDTLLPYHPDYAFLERSSPFKCYGVEYGIDIKEGVKYTRLKTAKFLGNISQGLIMPLATYNLDINIETDADVSEIVGVVKYSKPIHVSMCGSAKGSFPSFITKTDEERIQNIKNVLPMFNGKEVYETLKVDGTSATYYYLVDKDEFGICSRNMQMLEDGGSIYALIAERYQIKDRLIAYCKTLNKSIAIQGEIAGQGIQGNKLKIEGQKLFLFTAQEIIGGTHSKYLSAKSLSTICELLSIRSVPFLQRYIFDSSKNTLENYLKEATQLEYNGVNCCEGKVIRVIEEDAHGAPPRGLSRWSFKVINNEYKD